MDYRFYNNSVEFYSEVQALIPDFNLNKSLFLLDQSFFIKEEYFPCTTLDAALNHFNKLIGKEYYNVSKSITMNDTYTIFFEPVIEKIVPKVTVKEDPVVHISEDTPLSDSLISLTVEDDGVDWKMIDSLKNTKADKLTLDKYAEGFGISLNRGAKLENMIKAFKEELAKK